MINTQSDPHICTTCGHTHAPPRIYTEHLTPGLVHLLIRAVQKVHEKSERGDEKPNRFHLVRDLDLRTSTYTNFQKPRYFGLAVPVSEKKTGYWLITRNGGRFLRGEIEMHRRVKTYDNRIVERSFETVRR